MLDFETGVQIGQALSDIKNNTRRISALETEVGGLKTIIMRSLLLAVLWLIGIAGNLSAQQMGETLAAFVKAWAK